MASPINSNYFGKFDMEKTSGAAVKMMGLAKDEVPAILHVHHCI